MSQATLVTPTASGASRASSSLAAQSQSNMALMSDAKPSSAAAGAETSSTSSSMNLGQIKYKDSSGNEVTKQATIIFLDANGNEMNPAEDYVEKLARKVDRLRGLLSCMIGDQQLTQKNANDLESVDEGGYHVGDNLTITHSANSLNHWKFLLNTIKGTNDSSSSRESNASPPVIPQQPSSEASLTNLTPLSGSSASSVVSDSTNKDDNESGDDIFYSASSSRSQSPVPQSPQVSGMGPTLQSAGVPSGQMSDEELRKALEKQSERIAQIRLNLSQSTPGTLSGGSGNSIPSLALRALGAGKTTPPPLTMGTPTGVRILVAPTSPQ